jgi:hypothetical protein
VITIEKRNCVLWSDRIGVSSHKCVELSQTCDRFLNFDEKNRSKSPFFDWEAPSIPVVSVVAAIDSNRHHSDKKVQDFAR